MAALCYTVPPAADGVRLGVFLRAQGVSASCIKAVKHQGEGFFADGRPLHTDQPVRAGQRITFALPPEPPTAVQPQPVPFSLLYEDEFTALVDKPAGIAVHPTLNHSGGTLANGWLYHLQQQGRAGGIPAGQPHRQKHQRPGAAGAERVCGPGAGGQRGEMLPCAGGGRHKRRPLRD